MDRETIVSHLVYPPLLGLVVSMFTLGCGEAAADPGDVAQPPRQHVYRLADDGVMTRTDATISAETTIGRRADIENLRVDVGLETSRSTEVALRLERETTAGGERIPLLSNQIIDGQWEFDVRVDKFRGAKTDGTWRIVIESDDARLLDVETIQLTVRSQS